MELLTILFDGGEVEIQRKKKETLKCPNISQAITQLKEIHKEYLTNYCIEKGISTSSKCRVTGCTAHHPSLCTDVTCDYFSGKNPFL